MNSAHALVALAMSALVPTVAFAGPSTPAKAEGQGKVPSSAALATTPRAGASHHHPKRPSALDRRVEEKLVLAHAGAHSEPSAIDLANVQSANGRPIALAKPIAVGVTADNTLPALPKAQGHHTTPAAPSVVRAGHHHLPTTTHGHGHSVHVERSSVHTKAPEAAKAPAAAHSTHASREARTPQAAGKAVAKDSVSPPHAAPAAALECGASPVEFTREGAHATVRIARCDGTVDPEGLRKLSWLLEAPAGTPMPQATAGSKEWPDSMKPLDPRLVAKIQTVASHFGHDGKNVKLDVISSLRPNSVGSMHALGRAMDVRAGGVKNEDLVAFCKTLPDTGCGYYPNSSFVHFDARDPGTGQVSWIDASKPGEAPRYVKGWPEVAATEETAASNVAVKTEVVVSIAKLDEPKSNRAAIKADDVTSESLPAAQPLASDAAMQNAAESPAVTAIAKPKPKKHAKTASADRASSKRPSVR